MSSYKVIKFKGAELPEQYKAMVYSKFLRSLRYGNDYFKLIDKDAYFEVYHNYFNSLLSRPEAIIKLAVLSDDTDVVLGWALVEPNILHYVYVNKDYRKTGIGTYLVSDPFSVITHLTTIGVSIWASKYSSNPAKPNPVKPLVQFNPFS